MRRVFAIFLILLLSLGHAFAGISSDKARYVGGTEPSLPQKAMGFLGENDATSLVFTYGKGKTPDKTAFPAGTFTLPFSHVVSVRYGQHASLRIGETIALASLAGVGGLLLLLSKAKTHYVTLTYSDSAGTDQSAVFEVGKDVIRPLLSSLEVRTGKKIEYEVGSTGKAAAHP